MRSDEVVGVLIPAFSGVIGGYGRRLRLCPFLPFRPALVSMSNTSSRQGLKSHSTASSLGRGCTASKPGIVAPRKHPRDRGERMPTHETSAQTATREGGRSSPDAEYNSAVPRPYRTAKTG